jgi:predicted GIY-YIG superfamily endonuclease
MEYKPTWIVYCLSTIDNPIRTYIGATVDKDRRLQQHNGILQGGAKATKGRAGEWYRVCHVSGFPDSHSALSFEWRWKYFTKQQNGSPLTRREKALESTLQWASTKWPSMVLESHLN